MCCVQAGAVCTANAPAPVDAGTVFMLLGKGVRRRGRLSARVRGPGGAARNRIAHRRRPRAHLPEVSSVGFSGAASGSACPTPRKMNRKGIAQRKPRAT
ncbi:hypothetical protein GCM10011326_13060 [Salipiger profundus]|nr:hypothetical protein GCM10011326_13060 [Salipiger profundus]